MAFFKCEGDDKDFETHWKVKAAGDLIKKSKNMLVSTQTGFEMTKSRLCVGALS